MYTERHRRRKVVVSILAETAVDERPTPPEALELKEEGSPLEQLLRGATTPREMELVNMIEELLDETWHHLIGKALRGELRRRFMSKGHSKYYYNLAFHAIEQRRRT